MTRTPKIRRALLALALLAGSSLAQAHLDFAWSLDNWTPQIGVGQTLQLEATLYNSAASSEALRGDRLAAVYFEDIEDAFTFVQALPSLADQLEAVVLQPGESFSFVFGRFVPLAGLGPGSYTGGGLGLAFIDDQGQERAWTPEKTLLISVQPGSDTPTGVPEPASGWLALVAAAAALASRRRFRRG